MAKRRKKKEKINRIDVEVVIMLILSILLFCLIYIESGYIGETLSPLLGGIFGFIKYIIPIGTFAITIYLIYQDKEYLFSKLIQYGIFLCAITVIMSTYQFAIGTFNIENEFWSIVKEAYEAGTKNIGGGAIGTIIAIPLIKLVDIVGTFIISGGIIIVSLVLIFKIQLASIIADRIDKLKERKEQKHEERILKREEKISKPRKEKNENELPEVLDDQITININEPKNEEKNGNNKNEKINPDTIDANLFKQEEEKKEDKTKEVLLLEHALTVEDENYEFPPIEFLEFEGKQGSRSSKKAVTETAAKLQKTLYSFGVSAKVENVSVGPAITRYELKPAEGVRVSKIAKLADDIALNLAAESIRIEAPIPGKQAVGIEISNKEKEIVHLREIIDTDEFKNEKSKVPIALGKNVAGEAVIADIAKMPHVLIAGSTGSGKSVCINTLVTSIIYKAKPSEVKLVMIDPKVVELSIYNGIPHLLIPVVTDPKKAAGALAWAVQEMVNRYGLFAAKGVRDIKGYNEELEKEGIEGKLPQIVIIIDELADLMMVAQNDVEDAICRLAQMARAAGMHLVIATQRPSVDVITGIIKANIPSRISFAVSSGVDSRTILDMVGAEKLLGKGDMLFFPVGKPKPIRIQGAFISDKEVERIVDFLKANGEAKYNEDILEKIEKTDISDKEADENNDDIDELLDDAIETVIETGQASAVFIQRRFKVGYARAGRILDQMEKRGIISGYQGSKPRKVLISKEEWQEMKMGKTEENKE